MAICPQCKKALLVIRQAEDSHFKEVYCYLCNYRCWLSQFNHKTILTSVK